VSLTARDKKLALILVPVVVLAAYWFLLLAPKRHDAAVAGRQAQKQEQKRDRAKSRLAELQASRSSFAADYAQMVRLGKAIPTSVDMPSLMVQLQAAANGTGISFTQIKAGDRQQAASASSSSGGSSSGSSSSGSSGSRPVDAGGSKAQSGAGSAVESANNTKQAADQRSAAAEKSGASPADTQTSTSAKSGLPVGGGSAAPSGGNQGSASSVPGLDTVPLDLEFEGNFLKLGDFFHRLKRFVRLVNQRVSVNGRLMTVEGLNFSTDSETFPRVKADLTATVYLSPVSEGQTAGATPQGPSGTTPASGTTTTAGSTTSSPTPAATATPKP
jgi:type IV pilus assembly PilO-like protein